MKILPPHKIGSEILDLIVEAKEYLLIVSPYVNFNNWQRLASELESAKNKGVRIDFFVRNEPDNVKSWENVESLGINARLVNNLHAKFYLNENTGVISSMNLLSSSNSNSIEIGTKLDSIQELKELQRYVKDFIAPNEVKEKPSDNDIYLVKEKFNQILQNILYNNGSKRVNVFYKDGTLNINAFSNKFFLDVDKVKNTVVLAGVISHDELKFYEIEANKNFKTDYFDISGKRGDDEHYNTLIASSVKRLSTNFLDNLRIDEKKELLDEVGIFIYSVYVFKEKCHKRRKS
ncbi:phospholipase D-like domain-containing protein [Saccharicrinis sp. FJH62]|uniref:phospholipase D-like domain-containing protein n=1 Tax=Saccharicrinis sp. FJH62 TaxID=3344657 RepID=UPI0035D45135